MRYKLSELIESESKVILIDTECPSFDIAEDYQLASPIQVKGRLYYENDMIGIDMMLSYETRIICSRCSEPASAENNVLTEDSIPIVDFRLSYGDDFALCDVIRDQILLQVPLNTLCSENCKGLCPTCGCNRNDIECDCEIPERINPQFAALKNWQNETGKE